MRQTSAQSLILVIFVITAFAAITVTLAALTTKEVEIREIEETAFKARYTSDAGYERALYYLKTITREWPTYPYRRKITIKSQPANTKDLINYPVPIIINTAELIHPAAGPPKMEPDCKDVRFTDSDGMALIDYYLETGTCDSPTTRFWVRVPKIPQSPTEKKIYIYYGGGPTVDSGSKESVCPGGVHQEPDSAQWFCYELFDDFTGASLDIKQWISGGVGSGSSVSVSGGIVTLKLGNSYADNAYLNSFSSFPRPFLAKFRIRTTSDYSLFAYLPSARVVGMGALLLYYQNHIGRYNDSGQGGALNIAHNGIVSTWKKDAIIWEEDRARFYVEDVLIYQETIYIPEQPMRYSFVISCDQAGGCGSWYEYVDWALIRTYAPDPIDDNPGSEIEVAAIEEPVPPGMLPGQVTIDATRCPDALQCTSSCVCDQEELLQSQYEYSVVITPYANRRSDGSACTCPSADEDCCCEPKPGNYCIDSTGLTK